MKSIIPNNVPPKAASSSANRASHLTRKPSRAARLLLPSPLSDRPFPMPAIAYREAIRHALSEELTSDPNVVVMGEEVAQFNGAYKVTEGLL